MAELCESLLGLEDELTCSICLGTFVCPVTIPCGHNFCQLCLLATWTDTYSCPQCRTLFPTKPELKKNTVLSTVVETFNLRSNKSEASLFEEETATEKKTEHVIRCDTCMEAKAAQTCLTCMASFCDEHLQPHRENPVFRLHQLSEPVGDLSERICPDHHKLMELFCSQHSRPICSLCLQQTHKGCSFTSPEEQRTLKECGLRSALKMLNGKITKNESVVTQMRDMQNKLKDSATYRKKAMMTAFQQMQNMLAQEESDAMNAVDCEVETGQTKLRLLEKRFSENIETMSKAKEDIHSMLSQSQTLAFLQTSFTLPEAVNFDPYTPRINLDSKKVMATQIFVANLKDYLAAILKQPMESRVPLLKPGEGAACDLGFPPSSSASPQESAPQVKTGSKKKPQKTKKPPKSNEALMGNKNLGRLMENLLEFGAMDISRDCPPVAEAKPKPGTSDISPNITSAEKRSELLKFGTVLTFNPRTAHRRITLSEGFTKASVSDEHANYPECPERFSVCSQVLAGKGFSRGRHYWEVRMSSNNFVGIGLAYGGIDRKGPTSRLGRNALSWCIEWFNVKLSAWHNSSETVLVNPNPKRIGVLLDCEGGMATFYSVGDRAYPFHSFVIPGGVAAIYPAFWIFSSGSSISFCKLQA